jgi:SprT protein
MTGAAIIKRSAPAARVQFDLRGQSAGQFRVDASGVAFIRYNRALLARHADAFLAQTLPHEVAHYLTYLRFGRRAQPHGQEWQQIMQSLGADPRRCHEFDVSGLKTRHVRRFVYHCRCGDQELTSIRHHRIQRGAGYTCRRCGQTLRPGSAPAS